MSAPTDLLDRALALPADQRADVARHLLLSLEEAPLDDQNEVDQLWAEEIDTRIDRADAGESTESDWREAVERVRKSLFPSK